MGRAHSDNVRSLHFMSVIESGKKQALMGAPWPFMSPDSRGFPLFGNISGLQSGEPPADGFAERFNFKPAMKFRETIEFQQSRLQQVSRPQEVRVGIMVKRRGNLNQA